MGRTHGTVRVDRRSAVPYVAQLVRHVEHLGRPSAAGVVGPALHHVSILGIAIATVSRSVTCPGIAGVGLESGGGTLRSAGRRSWTAGRPGIGKVSAVGRRIGRDALPARGAGSAGAAVRRHRAGPLTVDGQQGLVGEVGGISQLLGAVSDEVLHIVVLAHNVEALRLGVGILWEIEGKIKEKEDE